MAVEKQVEYFGRDLEAMSFAMNYHRWILDEFKSYLGPCTAEVGAGAGNFSKMLINSKHIETLITFEPSDNMYPLLKKNLESFKDIKTILTIHGYFGEKCADFKNYFDSIVYVNVLEHIEQDKKELSYIHNSLKENGYICIFVPALSWLYSNFDKSLGHFRRYKRKEIADILKSRGFEIIKIKYFDFAGIVLWYVAFVLLNKSVSSKNVCMYDKMIVPIMRMIERIISPPIGKNLLLVGKKSD